MALLTRNVLEVVAQPHWLPLLIDAAGAWLLSFPDDRAFWIDYGIGSRVCAQLEAMGMQEPSLVDREGPLRERVESLLADLAPGMRKIGVTSNRRRHRTPTRHRPFSLTQRLECLSTESESFSARCLSKLSAGIPNFVCRPSIIREIP
jgi:hypothetical protein